MPSPSGACTALPDRDQGGADDPFEAFDTFVLSEHEDIVAVGPCHRHPGLSGGALIAATARSGVDNERLRRWDAAQSGVLVETKKESGQITGDRPGSLAHETMTRTHSFFARLTVMELPEVE